ncbi:permease [candidate division KSB1 bacterium]|nr:permease [candidate division KSB1 bacterium]
MIVNLIFGILKSSFDLLKEMAPYLVFGFISAGILKEFISAEKIAKHLGKSSLGSVLKAALFGIPLPLCSCGVIPPTMALRNAGASKGAVLSFLIATPTTGVDSIFATYSLLGPVFAVYRVIASFLAGIFSGFSANLLETKTALPAKPEKHKTLTNVKIKISFFNRIQKIFSYAFLELMSDIGKWLVIGILIGGVITYLIPADFFQTSFTSPWQALLLILIVSVPLYVCATGTIPIAAALMLKGLNPGAAFVLLLAGPATNAVTITVISKYLGKKTTVIYLVTLVLSSLGLGFLLDFIWTRFDLAFSFQHHMNHQMLPGWLEIGSAVFLTVLLLYVLIKNQFVSSAYKKEDIIVKDTDIETDLLVPGMTCNNCVNHVKNALINLSGINNVNIDLKSKNVKIIHKNNITKDQMVLAVENSGYMVSNK